MNRQMELMLQLQELVLMRRAKEMVQPDSDPSEYALMDQKINRLRHKLPGSVLSEFDALLRQWPDAVAQLSARVCQGCQQSVPAQVVARSVQSRDLARCPHCGRFLLADQHTPPYVGVQ
jgi:predicted  nucleic acid-binding Zn-ribbon protein